ncbi:helix-turn-helix domain-containing protein [Bacteroides fragilis]
MKKSNIYIGEIIKNVMSERQVTKAELARRLDVKPQSVDYLLTRKSIDTDTLYNISIALDYDFPLYSIKREQRNSDNEGIRYKLGNAKIMVEIELQQDEIIKLNLKKKIAELLDGGANK